MRGNNRTWFHNKQQLILCVLFNTYKSTRVSTHARVNIKLLFHKCIQNERFYFISDDETLSFNPYLYSILNIDNCFVQTGNDL